MSIEIILPILTFFDTKDHEYFLNKSVSLGRAEDHLPEQEMFNGAGACHRKQTKINRIFTPLHLAFFSMNGFFPGKYSTSASKK